MDLLIRYHRNPSLDLRNQLVKLNAGLVRQNARRFTFQCTEPYEDLEQVGYIGLISAIERFDPHQGRAFSSLAVPYIRGEILRYLRDKGNTVRIPRRWQELRAKAKRFQEQTRTTLGRQATDEEMAIALAIPLSEWHECQIAIGNRRPVSLDVLVRQQDDNFILFLETLPDLRYQDRVLTEEEQTDLHGAIAQLQGKAKDAIAYVFLAGLTQKEAGEKLGCHYMTLARYAAMGVSQLRWLMDDEIA